MSWLSDLLVGPSAPEINDLMNSIGALLVGKNTFTGDDPNKGTEHEGAFGGQWHGPTVVLTHDPEPANHPDMVFATDMATAVSTAKQAANAQYVNVLGANVAAQCLDAGLLDEVLVFIAPILLGEGVRLYEHQGGTRVHLEPRDPQRTGPLSLWYRVHH